MSCTSPLALPCYDRITHLKNAHCLIEELSEELSKTEDILAFLREENNGGKMREYNELYDTLGRQTNCEQATGSEMFYANSAFRSAHLFFLVSLFRKMDIYCSNTDCTGMIDNGSAWMTFLNLSFTVTNKDLSRNYMPILYE